ncbi:MAG TPA: hypothetical protein VMZ69_04620, partial [Saprospiraceae bacterium]|nr:hypothetical protein [Saprospiraceae bacterium]
MKNAFIFISLLFLALIGKVQNCVSQQAMFRTYTVKDGLVMNRIRGFYQDASGFIWMYTWDGLSRYEGYRFRNYITGKELSHGLINDMIEFPVGTIHIALNDGTIEQIRNLEVQKKNQLKGPTFNSFYHDDSGNIIAGTDSGGVYHFQQNRWESLPALKNEKNIFAITQQDGLYYILGSKSITIVNSNDLNDIHILSKFTHAYDYFTCLYKDLHGNILVGTIAGLKEIKFDKNRPENIELSLPDFIP